MTDKSNRIDLHLARRFHATDGKDVLLNLLLNVVIFCHGCQNPTIYVVLRAELASSTVPGFTYRYTGMVEPQQISIPGRTGRDNIN